ncbi:hypothetical protein AX15_004380 [Amanita polypyramis BW_CC]|nr:hypothetical protein AX15_004380 [Amanita polypyramis BW_CC]
MFKAFALFAAFASLLVSAMPYTPHQLEARQTAAAINFTVPNNKRLFTCTGSFFGGDCAFQRISTGQCQTLPSEFQNSIQSVRPDPGFNCTIFTGSSCTGQNLALSFPYYNYNAEGIDYGSLPTSVNASTKSYKCVRSGLAPAGITGPGTGIISASQA